MARFDTANHNRAMFFDYRLRIFRWSDGVRSDSDMVGRTYDLTGELSELLVREPGAFDFTLGFLRVPGRPCSHERNCWPF